MKPRPVPYRIDSGWLSPARRVPSPNFGPRPPGCAVELLVIHCISLPPGQYGGEHIERLFCNELDCDAHPYFAELRGVEVSAHLLLQRDGAAVQFVNFDQRAWHAGRSRFRGRDECNDFSVGIELEGSDMEDYTEAQYRALAGVTRALMAAYPGLSGDRIAGHADIAPARKTDPGPAFDWAAYLGLLQGAGAAS